MSNQPAPGSESKVGREFLSKQEQSVPAEEKIR